MCIRDSNGAYGVLHASAVCWEGTPFGQIHEFDLHGSEGTLHSLIDWDTVQDVRGVKVGEPGPAKPLALPEHLSEGVRMDTVHNTYRDVFRTTDSMTRGWITAMAAGEHCTPDFAEGLAVQRVIDAAVDSADAGGCPIDLS